MALLNALNAIVFDPEAAVVVALPHDQLRESVPLFVAVKVNVGVWLVVFVTAHVVIIGAVILRVKFIVPVVTLFALSLTTTWSMYVPSQLHVTIGFCTVDELKLIVPPVGPDNFDQTYHEIHEMFPSTVMDVAIHVLVIISDHIVSTGADLSILYICTPVVTLPALSCTQA